MKENYFDTTKIKGNVQTAVASAVAEAACRIGLVKKNDDTRTDMLSTGALPVVPIIE